MDFTEEVYLLEVSKKTEGILLSDMNMSVRLYNCLRRGGYSTLTQVMLADPSSFRGIRNFGKSSEEELFAMIAFVKNSSRDDILALINLGITNANNINIVTQDQDKSVIEVALGKRLNVGTYMFRTEAGQLVEDIDLAEVTLSNRAYNCLLKNRINSLRTLSELSYGELEGLQGLGHGCVMEIISLITKYVNSVNIDEEVTKRIEVVADKVCDYYRYFIDDSDRETVCLLLTKSIVGLYIDGETIESIEDKSMTFYMSLTPIKDIIMDKLYSDSSDSIMSGTDIGLLCYSYGFSDYESKKAFLELVDQVSENKRVRVIDGKIYKYKFFLNEWLESLTGNLKVAVELRCQGNTLEEVGTQLDVTRERVRQIVAKGLRKVPALFEEDFSYIFEKYMFEDEEYASLFNISIFQINYLKLLHKKGNGDIQDFLNDTTVPESMKERVGRVFRKRIVFIDGECVPLKREIILQRLLKAFYSDKECTTEEFEKLYSDFLAENGLDNNESLLFPNSRAFEARIIDYPYSLYKLGKRIRYYDTSAVDINDLLIQIGIEQYNNTEISTLKLVRDGAEIMEAFDIRDEYELHNLLRKRMADINCIDITITRMPFITIGKADRYQQVEELLFQTAPITNYDLAIAYEDRYGVQKETVLANFFTNIDIYFHDGIFDIEQEELPSDVFVKMQEQMTGDIYLWSDVVSIYKKVTDAFTDEKINAMTLKKLGYKVYSQYVISNKYTSAEAFITHLLTRNPKIDINDIDPGIRHLQIFYSSFTALRDALDLIEIEKDIYVTYEYFYNNYIQLSKNELLDYGRKLTEGQATYFSINAIADAGICEYDLGVSSNAYFMNSIIRVQDGIKTMKIADVYLASSGGDLSYLGLISFLLTGRSEISIYELLDDIKTQFGLKLDKSRAIYILEGNTDYYYDGVFEIVCRGQYIKANSADEFWSKERSKNIISGKEMEIQGSNTSIAQIYWKDRFISFVEYCGNHFITQMKDLLNVNFDDLYERASDYNLSNNVVAGVMNEMIAWISGLNKEESGEEEPTSIFDLFFK